MATRAIQQHSYVRQLRQLEIQQNSYVRLLALTSSAKANSSTQNKTLKPRVLFFSAAFKITNTYTCKFSKK